MNRKFVILALFIVFSCGVFAQQKDGKCIYLTAEKMPEIKGGMAPIVEKTFNIMGISKYAKTHTKEEEGLADLSS